MGEAVSNLYLCDVALPFGDPYRGGNHAAQITEAMQVMEFVSGTAHYDALPGRDVLRAGLFAMTGYDGRFTICM